MAERQHRSTPPPLPQISLTHFADTIEWPVRFLGHTIMWANVLLLLGIASQVALRYVFRVSFPKLDELQWHLYALTGMTGMSYAMITDSHVRVDVFHTQFSPRRQALVEMLGLLFLLFPFLLLMVDQGFDYFHDAWRVNEHSESPQGLTARWALKAVIPASCLLLVLASVARFLRCWSIWRQSKTPSTACEPGWKYWRIGMLSAVAVAMVAAVFVRSSEEWLVVSLFLTFITLLFSGFPIAWVLAGSGVLFCGVAWVADRSGDMLCRVGIAPTLTGLDYRTLGIVVNRVWSTMANPVLVALPMFIFMGLMLDESGTAERLMAAIQRVLGRVRGGLALTVAAIGVILAASTGIIGASVVLLGVLSLPAMLQQNYSKPLATGIVAASGTLGILIPPSIMLVIMADQMTLSVGDLFMAALIPGLLIGLLYMAYILILGQIRPTTVPLPSAHSSLTTNQSAAHLLVALLPPSVLILAVLGSIFAGLATPTEASGVGALGATLLALTAQRLNLTRLVNVVQRTFNTTAYIFAIFIGATCFSLVLRELGGDTLIERLIRELGTGPLATVACILLVVFLLGFVLDWIEITLIILPVMRPIVRSLEIAVPVHGKLDEPTLVWFVILVAVTLQTSFLTPPVGFALFYLKGVCPPDVRLADIYRGILPFVLLQLLALVILIVFPELVTWLPSMRK
ncbi:MAG: TRAP transporter large permease subunit [Planctomycetales bacterium]|nr:TRAP transporter large permease subunit [Planctomycetales bacterium]